jgi:hypothetical protein
MDHLTTGPYPYHADLSAGLNSAMAEGGYLRYETKLGCFDGDTSKDWEQIEECLERLELANLLDGNRVGSGLVTRVELFRNYDQSGREFRRGLVAFNDQCEALFHAVNALIGYNGSGPILTRQILTTIGVPLEMFERANNEARSGSYTVVFSREQTEVYEGIVVSRHEGYLDRWEQWSL